MKHLARFVSHKTGLSPEAAEQAVEAVLEYLREILPGPIARLMMTTLKLTDKAQELVPARAAEI